MHAYVLRIPRITPKKQKKKQKRSTAEIIGNEKLNPEVVIKIFPNM